MVLSTIYSAPLWPFSLLNQVCICKCLRQHSALRGTPVFIDAFTEAYIKHPPSGITRAHSFLYYQNGSPTQGSFSSAPDPFDPTTS